MYPINKLIYELLPKYKLDKRFVTDSLDEKFNTFFKVSNIFHSEFCVKLNSKCKIYVSDNHDFFSDVSNFSYGLLVESERFLNTFHSNLPENVFFISKENINNVEAFENIIFSQVSTLNFKKLQECFDKTINQFINELSANSEFLSYEPNEYIKFMMKLRCNLELSSSKIEALDFLIDSFNSADFVAECGFISCKELKLNISSSNEILIPIRIDNDCIFLCLKFYDDEFLKFILVLFREFIFDIFDHESEFFYSQIRRDSILEEIPWPYALLSDVGSVVFHNNSFGKLKISSNNLLQIDDGEILETDVGTYLCKKVSFQFSESTFTIIQLIAGGSSIKSNELSTGLSARELGIVTGSIAHEINNPIAGILAALSVIELDISSESEACVEIQEMKKSANRCKEIIQIFLGFSKQNQSHKKQVDIGEAFEHAHNLMRFRMIESNILIKLNNQSHNKFISDINESVLTMIFYLLLNEVMNYLSHLELLSATPNKMEKVFCTIRNLRDEIIFEFDKRIPLNNIIMQSKLLKNLLNIEKFQISQINEGLLMKRV